ncbi:MFS transporter [Arthrobacter sp. MYb224]|uniref:MFS transporter n=1 Tax=Arthrobacter sp. MYb224 TaxID=1848600 RepID=UPI0015E3F753|nr:MFS transporter [Arthrobacter sp. MYb224]
MTAAASASGRMTPEQKRVAGATMVGTTVEWYDYFIYANAAALVLAPQFFTPAEGSLGSIIAFATVGISFLFRPLGAVVMGRVGDRYGRRAVLITTLIMMGVGTTLVGLLPTYATIGVWAPILLIFLRIVQGFSAGGEWGGAALMAVEHAPDNARGKFGAFPQLGVPAGMLLASAVSAIIAAVLSAEQFMAWGWRIPFLLSFVLILIGHYIRVKVQESPVFHELEKTKQTETAPLSTLFRKHPKKVIQATLVFMGNNTAGYMLTGGFILGYATNKLELTAGDILNIITIGSVAWLISTWFGGVLSDRIGRKKMFIIGWVLLLAWLFPLFLLIETANLAWVTVSLVVFGAFMGFSYGPLPALYAELFPARIRLSGASISYALGSVVGGAFAPTIAAALVGKFDTTVAVSTYLFIWVAASLLATLTLKDRTGADLYPHDADTEGVDLGKRNETGPENL